MSSAGAATSESKSEAATYVDALYRKVLLAVKASNAIPSEDDDYHYHCKFSTDFNTHVHQTSMYVQKILLQLTKSSKRNEENDDSDDDDDDKESSVVELFDGPEPRFNLTNLVDTLLDDASKQLEIAISEKNNNANSNLQPLENKPMVFDAKKDTVECDDKSNINRGLSRAANKPQSQFKESIDNSTTPFVSKLREKVHALYNDRDDEDDASMEDNTEVLRRQHPYYNEIKSLKYVDWQLKSADPATQYQKISIEESSYLWVDTEESLSKMVSMLQQAVHRVIAVDLEHHSYRSYLGLVCLMQISTATHDFLVDTLALRSQLQILNTVFCDPLKVKVFHGADSDILWLQRDLGLYVVNLFDTGQATRVLNYPRYSLAYLLKRHCGVEADKQYQLADWRIRPLDRMMVKYAREDTRYLLYIYDQLKIELLEASVTNRSNALIEVLQQSNQLCLQVYAKPTVSDVDGSALMDKLKGTVGLTELSDTQKRVFLWLYYWRDRIARSEDESSGYVMPNQVLMKITMALPQRSDLLFRTCNPVPVLVRKHAHEITTMIAAEIKNKATENVPSVVVTSPLIHMTATHKRKFDEVDEEESVSRSSLEMHHVRWQSGKRTAQAAPGDDAMTASLKDSFNTHEGMAVEKSNEEILHQVIMMVATQPFVISECVNTDTPVPLEPMPQKDISEPPTPKSLTETYKLTDRSKRRKTVQSVSQASSTDIVKEQTNAFIKQIGGITRHENKSELPVFDYAAATEQVSSAKFELKHTIPIPTSGKKGKKNQGGTGYNPFVAIRGGKTSGDDKNQPNNGAKAPSKKTHQMPRSCTFR